MPSQYDRNHAQPRDAANVSLPIPIHEITEPPVSGEPGSELIAAGDEYLSLALPHVNAVTASFREVDQTAKIGGALPIFSRRALSTRSRQRVVVRSAAMLSMHSSAH